METELLAGPRQSPDFSQYHSDIADLKLSDEQEHALLETLWTIMSSFVEMGFSVDVCGLLFDDFKEVADTGCEHDKLPTSSKLETPSDGSGKERAV